MIVLFAIRIFWPILLLLVIYLGIHFFLMYRRQKKLEKEFQKELAEETQTINQMYSHSNSDVIDAEYVEHDEKEV